MSVNNTSNSLILLLSMIASLTATACTSGGGGEIDGLDAGAGTPGLGVAGKHPVVEALELTLQQRRAWNEAWRNQGTVARPAVARARDLRRSLQFELERETPDAVTVGNYVIALDQIGDSLSEARADLRRALTDPLDDEQRSEYEALAARYRADRDARARPRPWLESRVDSYNAYKQFSSP